MDNASEEAKKTYATKTFKAIPGSEPPGPLNVFPLQVLLLQRLGLQVRATRAGYV
jgi:hypothetical protein